MNRLLALVKRALQTDARQFYPHLARLLLVCVLLWALIFNHIESGMTTAPGLNLFLWVVWCNYWSMTIAGAAFFAMAMTEEKEERTLSLLRMAGIGSTSLILGKWIPRLIAAGLLLSVQIPFTILAITLGGVLWDQVAAAYLALFAYLFLIGNLGLLASTIMHTTSSACGLVFGILIAYFIGPWILTAALTHYQGNFIVDAIFTGLGFISDHSCMRRLMTILSPGFNESMWSTQVIFDFSVGGVMFLAAWLLFDVCTRNEKEPGTVGAFDRLRRARSISKRGRVWDSALIWKEFHLLGGGFVFVTMKFFLYLAMFIGFTALMGVGSRIRMDEFGAILFGYSLFLGVIETAIVMCRVYRDEMTHKTWSTLTLLPRSHAEIVYGKLAGAMTAVLPLVTLMMIGILMWGEEFWEGLARIMDDADGFLSLCYFGLQVILAIHIATYLSIAAKWAVWPLAIFLGGGIVLFGNFIMVTCILLALSNGPGGGEDGFLLLMCLLATGMIVGVHVYIGETLKKLASE